MTRQDINLAVYDRWWNGRSPAMLAKSHRFAPCRVVAQPGARRSTARVDVEFFDGLRASLSASSIYKHGEQPASAGRTEAQLSLELRNHIHLRGFQTHRIQADHCEAVHQKAHEREEPGTPDYICVGSRPLRSSVAGKRIIEAFDRYDSAFVASKMTTIGVLGRDLRTAVITELDRFYEVRFYWEAKREKGGRVRATQRIWIDNARRRGIPVLEGPRSIKEVDAWLREEGLLK